MTTLSVTLGILLCCTLFFCLICVLRLMNVKRQLKDMKDVLEDIGSGNGNRRILAANHEMTAALSYQINAIVYRYEEQLSKLKIADENNRQMMTSLSHDVRTPLTTLIGYLDAVHKGIVVGKERDAYFEIARRKAHDLKDYIETLFDWFKLNSSEFALSIEQVELGELTRHILKDWIPIFEENHLRYEIEIPEKALVAKIDIDGYVRILNNLVQNVMTHSQAEQIKIKMAESETDIAVYIEDNGIGIEKMDMPYIFERLYKCDKGRSDKGSGLGLAIVKQMVEQMRGSITVKSDMNRTTIFTVSLPRIT